MIANSFDDNDNGDAAGAVYVFVRLGSAWTEQAKLVASDGAADDHFGSGVSLFGDTALIGARGDDDQGSAYVFVRSGGIWTEEAKLVASDGASGDSFGGQVALSGDTALIGSSTHDVNGGNSGAAYVFVGFGDAWSQQVKLLPDDGGFNDRFGSMVALLGNTALITAPNHDNANGSDAGAAYIFVRSEDTWTEQQRLISDDGAPDDTFGCCSAAISGDTVLVGAVGDDDGADGAGSAYIFVRSGERWSQQAKLLPSLPESPGSFSNSGALLGDTAIVGDIESNGFFGRVYIFVRSDGVWTEEAVLEEPAQIGFFGFSVGLSNGQALITRIGRGYVYGQVLFEDGFEAGDTSAWSVTVP